MALVSLGLLRCATAGQASAPVPAQRPALLSPLAGRYVITRDGKEVGAERFTITSSAGTWRVEGEVTMTWPAERTQGYRLDVSVETAEPMAFEVWFEIEGERQTARGQRREEFFVVETQGLAGSGTRSIPYARGTAVDFATPLFDTLVFSLLLPSLVEGRPVEVRTILLPFPSLSPEVALVSHELRGFDGPLAKLAVSMNGRRLPTAFWVRKDGLPVRVRTWADDGRGAPFEMRLDGI